MWRLFTRNNVFKSELDMPCMPFPTKSAIRFVLYDYGTEQALTYAIIGATAVPGASMLDPISKPPSMSPFSKPQLSPVDMVNIGYLREWYFSGTLTS